MTIEEAIQEGRRRWGDDVAVGASFEEPAVCRVGWMQGRMRCWLGVGDTWEKAFLDADLRSRRRPWRPGGPEAITDKEAMAAARERWGAAGVAGVCTVDAHAVFCVGRAEMAGSRVRWCGTGLSWREAFANATEAARRTLRAVGEDSRG